MPYGHEYVAIRSSLSEEFLRMREVFTSDGLEVTDNEIASAWKVKSSCSAAYNRLLMQPASVFFNSAFRVEGGNKRQHAPHYEASASQVLQATRNGGAINHPLCELPFLDPSSNSSWPN